MTIRQKLILNALLTSICIAIVGGLTSYSFKKVDKEIDFLTEVTVNFTLKAQSTKAMMLQHRRYEKDFFLNIGNAEKQEGYLKGFDGKAAAIRAILEEIQSLGQKLNLTGEQAEWVKNLPSYYEAYNQGFLTDIVSKVKEGSMTPQEANKAMKPYKTQIHTLEQTLDSLVEHSNLELKNAVKSISELLHRDIKTSLVACGIILLISLLIAIVIARSIISPLQRIIATSKLLGKGDLTQRLDSSFTGEIGDFATQINQMVDMLSHSFAEVKQKASSLKIDSNELSKLSIALKNNLSETSSSAHQISQSTEEVTTNVNVMASASEEMSSNTTNVARHADEISESIEQINVTLNNISASISSVMENTDEAHNVSDKAKTLSQKLTEQVRNLATSAKEIGGVTEVIKKIAEQTNLLALNATIEAASAGDAGKGFSVVASEIKELARQSSHSAEDITNRINDIQACTKASVDMIGDVTKIIDTINEMISTIAKDITQQNEATQEISSTMQSATEGVSSIATSTKEVSAGSSEMAKSCTEVMNGAQLTSRNASQISSKVKEDSKTAEKLSKMSNDFEQISKDLDMLLNQFKLS